MYGDQAVYTFDKYVESFDDGFISTLTANSYHGSPDRNITVNLPDDYMDKVADRQQEYWVFWY